MTPTRSFAGGWGAGWGRPGAPPAPWRCRASARRWACLPAGRRHRTSRSASSSATASSAASLQQHIDVTWSADGHSEQSYFPVSLVHCDSCWVRDNRHQNCPVFSPVALVCPPPHCMMLKFLLQENFKLPQVRLAQHVGRASSAKLCQFWLAQWFSTIPHTMSHSQANKVTFCNKMSKHVNGSFWTRSRMLAEVKNLQPKNLWCDIDPFQRGVQHNGEITKVEKQICLFLSWNSHHTNNLFQKTKTAWSMNRDEKFQLRDKLWKTLAHVFAYTEHSFKQRFPSDRSNVISIFNGQKTICSCTRKTVIDE